ncbi:unnamed protein product [Dibothriocephalus latus]|uniref:Uncharacterized protein n=1 Tax=Dibothriocephalus latus TaxID=60516 RepID=A0A3P7LDK9_DIBLA|nr:unnamed protein product [Dibothriocephalus latus]
MSWAVYLMPDGDGTERSPSTAAVAAEEPFHSTPTPQPEGADKEQRLSFAPTQSEVDSRRQLAASNGFSAGSADHASSMSTGEVDRDDEEEEVDENMRVYSVLVPKIDNSLGLSIVAARVSHTTLHSASADTPKHILDCRVDEQIPFTQIPTLP